MSWEAYNLECWNKYGEGADASFHRDEEKWRRRYYEMYPKVATYIRLAERLNSKPCVGGECDGAPDGCVCTRHIMSGEIIDRWLRRYHAPTR